MCERTSVIQWCRLWEQLFCVLTLFRGFSSCHSEEGHGVSRRVTLSRSFFSGWISEAGVVPNNGKRGRGGSTQETQEPPTQATSPSNSPAVSCAVKSLFINKKNSRDVKNEIRKDRKKTEKQYSSGDLIKPGERSTRCKQTLWSCNGPVRSGPVRSPT